LLPIESIKTAEAMESKVTKTKKTMKNDGWQHQRMKTTMFVNVESDKAKEMEITQRTETTKG
jgi:hypothetical protein